jgi:hypothetical protein
VRVVGTLLGRLRYWSLVGWDVLGQLDHCVVEIAGVVVQPVGERDVERRVGRRRGGGDGPGEQLAGRHRRGPALQPTDRPCDPPHRCRQLGVGQRLVDGRGPAGQPPIALVLAGLEGAGSGMTLLVAGTGGAQPCGLVVQLPAVADRPDQPAGGIRAGAGGQHIQRIRDLLGREPGDQVVGDRGGDAGRAQPSGQRHDAVCVAIYGCCMFFFNSMSMHDESISFSVSGGTVSGKCGHGAMRAVERRRLAASDGSSCRPGDGAPSSRRHARDRRSGVDGWRGGVDTRRSPWIGQTSSGDTMRTALALSLHICLRV